MLPHSRALLMLACLAAGPSLSDVDIFDQGGPAPPADMEERETTWQEGDWDLPPWPKEQDLVAFGVDDPGSRLRQYIDAESLRIGADGAVRYTLVVESESGVRNLSFEGMRCTPRGLVRIYAFGYDGRFQPTSSEWTSLRDRPDNKIHRDLHRFYLCRTPQYAPRRKQEILRAMKTGHPPASDTGFLRE